MAWFDGRAVNGSSGAGSDNCPPAGRAAALALHLLSPAQRAALLDHQGSRHPGKRRRRSQRPWPRGCHITGWRLDFDLEQLHSSIPCSTDCGFGPGQKRLEAPGDKRKELAALAKTRKLRSLKIVERIKSCSSSKNLKKPLTTSNANRPGRKTWEEERSAPGWSWRYRASAASLRSS